MANLRVDKITSTETFETTGSVQFDGVDDGLTISDNAAFDLGTGDFTIEGWYYLANAGTYVSLFDFRGSGADGVYPSLFRNNTGDYIYYYVDSAQRISNVSINYNTWFHVAVCRSSGITRLFLNGKEKGSFQDSFDYVSRDILLGVSSSNSNDLTGNISNYRIVKGRAFYTANFKPPMRELEVTPETVLLACQSKTDATLEKTGKTITASGAVASELTPGILTPIVKSGGGSAITGSVEFDGTGDYLSITEPSDFDFGADDFTMEYWYNEGNDDRTERRVLYCYDTTQAFMIGHTNDNGGQLFFSAHTSDNAQVAGGIQRTASNSNPTGKRNYWRHVAACRDGATFRMFLDGVLQNTTNFGTTAIRGDQNTLYIGQDPNNTTTRNFRGFLSNLRIVKGTALYTDYFIPPTRELKRVPGTVLLCCQDPNNPLTEATGKTITGHGSLHQIDTSIDLAAGGTWVDGSTGDGTASESNGQITMQGNGASDRGIISKTVTVEPGITYEMSFNVTDASTNGKTGLDSNDGTDDVLDDPTNICDMVQVSGSDLDGNTGTFRMSGVAKSTECVMYFQEFGAAGTTNFIVDNITLHAVGGGGKGASNFTPQVGDDRKVTFEGVTKINSNAYFYLPTGNTESRDSGGGVRGVFVRGQSDTPSPTLVDTIEYINISSTGNAINFGDAAVQAGTAGACSDSTRGIQGGGQIDGGTTADILRFIIASTGTAVDSGADLLSAGSYVEALSSSTRAVFVGGTPPGSNVLQFTEIQSLGDTVDFGNLNNNVFGEGTCCDGVRGVIFGGTTGPASNERIDNIDYIIVSSKGDAQDFGNLGAARAQGSGFSNKIRGIYAGGRYQPQNNIIEYVTIATTGNANDFGDLISQASRDGGGTCSSTRGVHAGGDANPSPTDDVNTIQYITIMSMGNALDFGDLTERKTHMGACSNGHGGLG